MKNAQLKKDFVSANLIQMLGMIRCGFELEFQKLDGQDKDDARQLDYDDYDRDLLRDDSRRALNDAPIDELISLIDDDRVQKFATGIMKTHCAYYWSDIIVAAAIHINEVYLPLKRAEYSWRQSWEDEALSSNPERYYPTTDAYGDLSLPEYLELTDDSSVRGGEIRTVGPLTANQFFVAMKDAFDLDLSIDSGCSFHIHLSLVGMQHKYGKNLQYNMMKYLIENFEFWPDSVKKRIKNTKYYKFDITRDKYSMVNFHEQGTWEFRIFGNVTNALDGYKCLILACRALQYAYSMQALGESPIDRLDGIIPYLDTIFRCAIEKGTTVDRVIHESHKAVS